MNYDYTCESSVRWKLWEWCAKMLKYLKSYDSLISHSHWNNRDYGIYRLSNVNSLHAFVGYCIILEISLQHFKYCTMPFKIIMSHFNGDRVKTPLNFGQGWVISSHSKQLIVFSHVYLYLFQPKRNVQQGNCVSLESHGRVRLSWNSTCCTYNNRSGPSMINMDQL